MIVSPIKTDKILAGSSTILEVLDKYLPPVKENSVVAVTSKVISLCQNRVVSMAEHQLDDLIIQESSLYSEPSKAFGQQFTVTHHTLIPKSGIDKNSKRGYYILWPQYPQLVANEIRSHIAKKFDLENIGVIITDSTSTPLRLGVVGIAIAHSGFEALNSYAHSRANISGGLAAAAVVAMGEGTEHTPIAIISDVPLVNFQSGNPAKKELEELHLSIDEDFFQPFLSQIEWLKGKEKNT